MTDLQAPSRSKRLPRMTAPCADGLVVAGIAFAIRMTCLLTSRGGLAGNFGYDAGVYYAAAASLLHGATPYADFTLLHPPGLMLSLTPFAAVGRITSDHLGFESAVVAFIVLASVNAALVSAIARRCGLPRRAALLGGLFYAVWFGAVGAEISARLEPLGSLAFLSGFLLLVPDARRAPRRTLCGGALLGVAVAVKIWWVAPVLVLVIWTVAAGPGRAATTRLCAGLSIGLGVVVGPFLLAAPGPMFRMVVADQLGRPPAGSAGVARLDALTSFPAAHAFPGLSAIVPAAAAGVLAVALSWSAWSVPVGRAVVAVFWTQVIVLVVAPTYFSFYSGYLAPSAALVVAFAAAGHRARLAVGPAQWAVVGASALTVAALVLGPRRLTSPFPDDALAGGVEHVRCLMTDSPMALIELDALTRNLDHGCPSWVDVTGRTYDVDAPPGGRQVPRRANERWQHDVLRYLRSGDAAVVVRSGTGLDATTRRTIRFWPVLLRAGGVTVYRAPAETATTSARRVHAPFNFLHARWDDPS